MTSIQTSITRRGRLLFLQLQRQILRRRRRNRKSSQRPLIHGKRRSRSQTPVQDIFLIGSVLTCRPSTPSSGHIWTDPLKRQLREFEFYSLLKTLSHSGFEPQSASRLAGSLPLSYRVFLLRKLVLTLHIRTHPSLRVCGHGCVLMAFSSSYSPFERSCYAESMPSLCSSSRGRVGNRPTLPKTFLPQTKSLLSYQRLIANLFACYLNVRPYQYR